MKFAQEPGPRTGPRRDAAARAFTLVEVMVATVLLSMIILGILAVLIGSYRVAAKARYNDHARYVIKSFADQFLTQQTTDSAGNILPLFLTFSQTGYGLTWTNSDGSTVSGGNSLPPPANPPLNISILLGDNTGAPITAQVSRQVWYLYPTGANIGQPTSLQQVGSAGSLLRADFTISYTFPPNNPEGTLLSQTITVTRSVP